MAFNMDPKKCPMPTQDPNVRNKNFKEVALGYTEEMAINEAKRCIHCKNKPCQTGCPVGIDIPEFIAHVAEGDFEAAYQVINRSSSLPAVCGRVCPQESQCEGKCTRGIKNEPVGIGRLERFVADWHRENVHTAPVVPEWNGHKVAIIGAGPAGLTAAGDLAKLGYKVTVYEALHVAGGVLMYGIPEFRLPKAIVQQEIDGLKKMGVDFECNMVIGKVLTIDELFEMGYEAVYVASGAGLPRFMGIPGESLKGVYSANEYLTRINLTMLDLRKIDLSRVNLRGVDFTGVDFTGVNIMELDLSECIITPEQIAQALGHVPTAMELKKILAPKKKVRKAGKFIDFTDFFLNDARNFGVYNVSGFKGMDVENLVKFGQKVFKHKEKAPVKDEEALEHIRQQNKANKEELRSVIEERKRRVLEAKRRQKENPELFNGRDRGGYQR